MFIVNNMKLDKKDLKLIYELDRNARIPYSQLAKKVGLSQESVRYRVNKLIKEEVIKKFFTVIDISKIGFTFYKILLKLHNVDETKVSNMINWLSQKKEIVWLTTLDGNYDIGCVIKSRNIFEFNKTLEEIVCRRRKIFEVSKMIIITILLLMISLF